MNINLRTEAVNAFNNITNFFNAATNYSKLAKKYHEQNAMAAINGFKKCYEFTNSSKKIELDCHNARENSPIKIKLGTDPFSLPISLHRQFQRLNENAYSDWLAWVIELLCKSSLDQISLCERLFWGETSELESSYKEVPDIQRETPIEQGHEGKSGRTDLLVSFTKNKLLWHIEVKVTSAESADLGKHQGYVSSLSKKFDGFKVNNILLVTQAAKDFYLAGESKVEFKVLLWEDVSRNLRQIVQHPDVNVMFASIAMLFCGLIEQQLLGIQADSIAQLKYLSIEE